MYFCKIEFETMKIKTLIIIFFISMTAVSQTAGSADKLFTQKDYIEAAKAYKHLLNSRPSNTLYNYRYARCKYELGNYDTAIDHFILSGTRYPLTDYYLADSYFNLYRFEHAIEFFNNYIDGKSTNTDFLRDAEDKIRRSEIASKLINRVEDIAIIDTLIVDKNKFLEHYELSRETGNFTINDKKLNNETINLISFITQRGDRKIYTDIIDNQTKLFTSNKLLDGWSKPEVLSERLNSYKNINYPFLMLDGITLYFASDSDFSIGGYDIFITRYNASTKEYLIPDNIGMPFNSFYNDYMMVIDETQGSGWFVSDRYQPENKVCIYHFEYNENKKYLNPEYSYFSIEYAQLKKFKTTSPKNEFKIEDISAEKDLNPHNNILIQINDSIFYTDINQFKSEEAIALWNECIQTKEDLNAKETLINSLRDLYNESKDAEDKKVLVKDITDLEIQILDLRLKIKENSKIIRNKEIKLLKAENTN